MMRPTGLAAGALGAVLLCAGCSHGSDTSPSPSPGNSFVITIGSGAIVSPKTLTVPRGSQVTFVNNDSRNHDMESDPHPEHTDCPEINSVGLLTPGRSRQTGNLNTVRSCGFHDHQDPENRNLRGTIVIQ
jgi:plastocyanin